MVDCGLGFMTLYFMLFGVNGFLFTCLIKYTGLRGALDRNPFFVCAEQFLFFLSSLFYSGFFLNRNVAFVVKTLHISILAVFLH